MCQILSFPFHNYFKHSLLSLAMQTTLKDELQRQLEGASMANRTLIIGVISNASAEDDSILQLVLQSMPEGEETRFLIKHILFAAADPTAYNNCKVLQLHCHQLYTEHVFTSPDASAQNASYTSLTWTQALFLGEVLGRGFSFIFTVSQRNLDKHSCTSVVTGNGCNVAKEPIRKVEPQWRRHAVKSRCIRWASIRRIQLHQQWLILLFLQMKRLLHCSSNHML